MSSPRSSMSLNDLLLLIQQQEDPIGWLAGHLREERVPVQGTGYFVVIITGIVIHSCFALVISLMTWQRHRNGQLWFSRRHQTGKLRLNATVITVSLCAIYSTLAMIYSALTLKQQHMDHYMHGLVAFKLCCFTLISMAVSVICFCHYQSLPAGFENSVLRRIFRKSHAATDQRAFGYTILCIWIFITIIANMIGPIIYDYWLFKADESIGMMLSLLSTTEIQQAGLLGIAQLTPYAEDLISQRDTAETYLRVSLLVWLGHAVLYIIILAPTSLKLYALLAEQIAALTKSADDYFRVESHNPTDTTHAVSRSAPAKYASQTATVVCQHCRGDVPVTVRFAQPDKTGQDQLPDHAKRKPSPLRTTALPQHVHSDFPLVKAKRLAKISRELAFFSTTIIAGLLAFTAALSACYYFLQQWDNATTMFAIHAMTLACYAIPGAAVVVGYVWLTLTLPKISPTVPDTPTSASTRKSIAGEKIPMQTMLPITAINHPQADHAESNAYLRMPVPARTKRTQPTFPRAQSEVSLSTTEAAQDADARSEASSFVPPLPVIVRKDSKVRRWVRTEHLRQSREMLSNIPERGPRTPQTALGPMSQSQSWIELDDD